MIDYPDDRSIAGEATRHDIPEPVLVRDLVRIVEVLNLKSKDFFSPRSVLAGSMALRCFDRRMSQSPWNFVVAIR